MCNTVTLSYTKVVKVNTCVTTQYSILRRNTLFRKNREKFYSCRAVHCICIVMMQRNASSASRCKASLKVDSTIYAQVSTASLPALRFNRKCIQVCVATLE